jgi:hypothetical protein
MALTIAGVRPVVSISNLTPVTVGVTQAVNIPKPATTPAGYHITWTIAGGASPDQFRFTAIRRDGSTLDLGDYTFTSDAGLFIRGDVSSVACIPTFAGGSTMAVTFKVSEVASVPEMQSVQRIQWLYTATPSPVVITPPTGVRSDLHEYSFSMWGTWTAGSVLPIEYEPGGFATDFLAQVANYRSARRVGPMASIELTLVALNSVGIACYFTHSVPV